MMRKNNWLKNNTRIRILTIVLLLCSWSGLLTETVHAAGANIVSIQIPVSCVAEETQETYYFYLYGEDSEAENIEVAELYLKNGERGVLKISYREPGTYHYIVRQKTGVDDKVIYDDTIYNVDVYVTTTENGELFAEPILYIEGQTQKKEELIFTNQKKQMEFSGKATGPKTGDSAQVKNLIVLMAGSVLGISGILFVRRKGRENAE